MNEFRVGLTGLEIGLVMGVILGFLAGMIIGIPAYFRRKFDREREL
jgi:ABC-type nitrate/sulfonate/bicarbonate transport system permease component